jgi:endoglucanase
MTKFCEQNEFIAKNTDVFVGFVGWSAGSFDDTYILTLTPEGSPGSYTDNKLMQKCILDVFNDPSKKATGRPTPSSATKTQSSSSSKTTTDPISHEATRVAATSPSPSDSSASVFSLTAGGCAVLFLSAAFQTWQSLV